MRGQSGLGEQALQPGQQHRDGPGLRLEAQQTPGRPHRQNGQQGNIREEARQGAAGTVRAEAAVSSAVFVAGGLEGGQTRGQALLPLGDLRQVEFQGLHPPRLGGKPPQLRRQSLLLLVQRSQSGLGLANLLPQSAGAFLQGRGTDHGAHGGAAGMGRADLPLGQIEGLDKIVEAITEQAGDGLGNPGGPRQGPVGGIDQDQARRLLAIPGEMATDLVVAALDAKPQGYRPLARAPVHQLADPILREGEGPAKEGEADDLADGALAALVVTAEGNDAALRQIRQAQSPVAMQALRLDAQNDHERPSPAASRAWSRSRARSRAA